MKCLNSRHCSTAAKIFSLSRHAGWLLLLAVFAAPFTPVRAQLVTYGGGPTMQGPITVFLIFWEPTTPTPLFYDSSTSTSDANYRTIIPHFFTDLAPSAYFNIITQYYGACESNSSNSCVVPNAPGTVTLGGAFPDPRPYPHAGTTTDPLQDSDIQTEIQMAIKTNGWPVGPNSEFFVFTTAGIQECSDPAQGCTFVSPKGPAFCGYHYSFGGPTIYAFIADPGCIAPSPAPNQTSTDGAIEAVSHEFFESIADPLPNNNDGWIDAAGEIADGCAGVIGPVQSNGSNVTLNNDPYVVQEIWSNDTLLCVLSFGPTLQLTAATGNDDLRYDSSVTASLVAADGTPFQGVLFKSVTQPTWGDRTSQVRVFGINQTQLGSLGLAMVPGGPGNDDEWKLAGLDVRLLDPMGNLICNQNITAVPGPLADLKSATPTVSFPTPNCSPQAAGQAWDSVEIQIRTGNDDASHDSEVTATIAGQSAPICLKPSTSSNLVGDPICTQNSSNATDQQGNNSWNNFTNSDQTFPLSPTETAASAFSTMTITLTNADPQCGNFGHEGCDNWDIEGVSVTVFNSQGSTPPRTNLLTIGNLSGGSSDDCLARLKSPQNSNATAVTFGLDGSDSHVYANGKEAGTITGCKNNGDNP
ncbi:MAG: hypothetical protein WBD45_18555 [Terriglobales bacterium]